MNTYPFAYSCFLVVLALALPLALRWRFLNGRRTRGYVKERRRLLARRRLEAANLVQFAEGETTEQLLRDLWFPDHAGAREHLEQLLTSRGVSEQAMEDWRCSPSSLRVPSFDGRRGRQASLASGRARRLARLGLCSAIVLVLGAAGAAAMLAHPPYLPASELGLVGASLGLGVLVMAFYLVLLALGFAWRSPLRIVLLRPFEQKRVSRDLKRFVRRNLGAQGHVFTVEDRYMRPVARWIRVPAIVLLAAIPFLSPYMITLLFRRRVRSERTFMKLRAKIAHLYRMNMRWALSRSKIFRISCTPRWWRRCVEMLLASSDLVVMDLSAAGEGVHWELRTLSMDGALARRTLFLAQEGREDVARSALARHWPEGRAPAVCTYTARGVPSDRSHFEAQYSRAVSTDQRAPHSTRWFGQLTRRTWSLSEGVFVTAIAGFLLACVCNGSIALSSLATQTYGSELLEEGRAEEALIAFEHAARIVAPQASRTETARDLLIHAHLGRGSALLELGRPRQARTAFEFAATWRPEEPDLHVALGACLQELGDHEAATAALRTAARIAEDDDHWQYARTQDLAAIFLRMAMSLTAAGRLEEARAAFSKAASLNPDGATFHYLDGVFKQGGGRHEQALDAFDRALVAAPEMATVHASRGLSLLALGKSDEALAACERALDLDPDLPAGHSTYAAALLELDRPEDARRAVNRAIQLDPDLAIAHAHRSEILIALGKHEEALAASERAIDLQPDLAQAHCSRGTSKQNLGRHAEAIKSFARALELDENLVAAHANRALSLLALGDPDAAMASAARALALQGDSAEAHNTYGLCLQALERHEEARASFNEAIALDPTAAAPHANLALSLHRLGRGTRALESCERAIELNPDAAESYHILGTILLELDRPEEALEMVDRSIALDAALAPFHLNRSATLLQLRRMEEALGSAKRAIELAPDLALAHYHHGVCLLELGQPTAALAALDRALELQPDLASAHAQRSLCLLTLREAGEARSAANRALAIDPDLAEAHNALGLILHSLGQVSEALEAFDRAIAARPRFAIAHLNRGLMLAELGEPDAAIAACRRAVSLSPNLPEAHVALGTCLASKSEFGAALESFERALQLDADHAVAHTNKVLGLLLLDRPEEARSACEIAITLQPSYPDLHQALGMCLDELGRTAEAKASYVTANELRGR